MGEAPLEKLQRLGQECDKDLGRPPSGRATHEPSQGLGHSVSVPSADSLPFRLRFVAGMVDDWLKWDIGRRDRETLVTDDGTHIMSLPVPYWPTHGQFHNWSALFEEAAQAIEARKRQDAETGLAREGESAVRQDAPKA